MKELVFADIESALSRIKNDVIKTPVITNEELNSLFGAEFFFKCEAFQKTGSFKARGVFNWILSYKERFGKLPEKISAVSSGNHAQAVSYVCSKLDIKSLIYMAKAASDLKILLTQKHGAEVIVCEKRSQANKLSKESISQGYEYIHPSDDDAIIAGQGTCVLEAFEQVRQIDAIFAPCGGGGLVSGSYIAANGRAKVFACEPENANDTARSLNLGKIFSYEEMPNSIADGVRTLSISERTFNYIKKIEGVVEASEEEIILATQVLMHYLKVVVEPTAALAFASAIKSLNTLASKPKILIILSGGNVSSSSYKEIFSNDVLKEFLKNR